MLLGAAELLAVLLALEILLALLVVAVVIIVVGVAAAGGPSTSRRLLVLVARTFTTAGTATFGRGVAVGRHGGGGLVLVNGGPARMLRK